MENIGIIGDPGNFKTALMTTLLVLDYNAGRKIISTHTVRVPGHRRMTFKQICKLSHTEGALLHCSIGFSELGVGADAYNFMSATAKDLKMITTQLRHDLAIAYYDCQNFRQITAPLRRATNGYLLPKDRDSLKNPGPYHRLTCRGVADVVVLDADMRQVNEFVFNAPAIYPYYNDLEKVLDDSEREE